MIIQAIAVFSVVVAAQVFLIAKAADLLSSLTSSSRDSGLTMSTGRVA